MAGIYGPIVEHPEIPVTDAGHFTLTILAHKYKEGGDIYRDGCDECGFPKDMPFHPECTCNNKHPFGILGAHYTDCPLRDL